MTLYNVQEPGSLISNSRKKGPHSMYEISNNFFHKHRPKDLCEGLGHPSPVCDTSSDKLRSG